MALADNAVDLDELMLRAAADLPFNAYFDDAATVLVAPTGSATVSDNWPSARANPPGSTLSRVFDTAQGSGPPWVTR